MLRLLTKLLNILKNAMTYYTNMSKTIEHIEKYYEILLKRGPPSGRARSHGQDRLDKPVWPGWAKPDGLAKLEKSKTSWSGQAERERVKH